jgi:hypothetical protein
LRAGADLEVREAILQLRDQWSPTSSPTATATEIAMQRSPQEP